MPPRPGRFSPGVLDAMPDEQQKAMPNQQEDLLDNENPFSINSVAVDDKGQTVPLDTPNPALEEIRMEDLEEETGLGFEALQQQWVREVIAGPKKKLADSRKSKGLPVNEETAKEVGKQHLAKSFYITEPEGDDAPNLQPAGVDYLDFKFQPSFFNQASSVLSGVADGFGQSLAEVPTFITRLTMKSMGKDWKERPPRSQDEALQQAGFFLDSVKNMDNEEKRSEEWRRDAIKGEIKRNFERDLDDKELNTLTDSLLRRGKKARQKIENAMWSGEQFGKYGLPTLVGIGAELKTFTFLAKTVPRTSNTILNISRTGAIDSAAGIAGGTYFEFLRPTDDISVEDKAQDILEGGAIGGIFNLGIDGLVLGGAYLVGGAKKVMKRINTLSGRQQIPENLGDSLKEKVIKMNAKKGELNRLMKERRDAQKTINFSWFHEFDDAVNRNARIKEVTDELIDLQKSFGDDLANIPRDQYMRLTRTGDRIKGIWSRLTRDVPDDVDETALFEKYARFVMERPEKIEPDSIDEFLKKIDLDELVKLDEALVYSVGRGQNEIQAKAMIETYADNMGLFAQDFLGPQMRQTTSMYRKQLDVLNEKGVLPRDMAEDLPGVKSIIEGDIEDMARVAGDPDALDGALLGGVEQRFTEPINRWVAPTWIKALKDEQRTGVPIAMAYLNLSNTYKQFSTIVNNGTGGIPGLLNVDEVAKKSGLKPIFDTTFGGATRKRREIWEYMFDQEYKPTDILENLGSAPLDEGQKEFIRFYVKTVRRLEDFNHIAPQKVIPNYVARPRRMDPAKAMNKAMEGEPAWKSFFEEERELGDLTRKQLKKLEKQGGYVIEKDPIQNLKTYIYSSLYRKQVIPATQKMEQAVDMLRVIDGTSLPRDEVGNIKYGTITEYWDDFMREAKSISRNEMYVNQRLMQDTEDMLRVFSPSIADKFRSTFAGKGIPGVMRSMVYNMFLRADQMFRIKNLGQSMLTGAEVGLRNLDDAHKFVSSNREAVDIVLYKMGTRGQSDQFIETPAIASSRDIVGGTDNETGRTLMQVLKEQFLGFGNISASDAFNVRRAGMAPILGIKRNLDDFLNGNIHFNTLMDKSGLDSLNPQVKLFVKQRLDEGRFGGILFDGERMSITEAIENLEPEQIARAEMDINSAEGILFNSVVFNSQWEYGKFAMGRAFKSNSTGGARYAQSLILPFTTWRLNYAYKLARLMDKPVKNADKLMQYMTGVKLYTKAAESMLSDDESMANWFFTGPLSIQASPLTGATTSAWSAFTLSSQIKLNELTGQENPGWLERSAQQGTDAFFRTVWGEGTFQRRVFDVGELSFKLTRDQALAMAGALEKSYHQELNKDRFIKILERLTDVDSRFGKLSQQIQNNAKVGSMIEESFQRHHVIDRTFPETKKKSTQ